MSERQLESHREVTFLQANKGGKGILEETARAKAPKHGVVWGVCVCVYACVGGRGWEWEKVVHWGGHGAK